MFKIITIPFDWSREFFDEDLVNRFILNKHVKRYEIMFFQKGEGRYWSVFLEYDPVVGKTPEKETEGLDEPQRVLLERLKAWRKERAEQDGVPVYIIGNNREMVQVALNSPRTLEALGVIKGFGKSKVEKYGREIIGLIKAFHEKT
ncbi:MAG: HRDC domain-containing protein [Pseudomonadota bacterium]